MKQNFKCDECVHINICKNKEFLDEIQEKVNTRINNIYIPPDNFEIIIRCKNYIDKQYIDLFPTPKNKEKCNEPFPF